MTWRKSTALCNKLLDTGSFATIFATARLRIYAGAVPATADEATGSAPIAEVSEGGSDLTFLTPAVGGVLSKSANVWQDPSAAGGVGTFFRLEDVGDDQSDDSGFIYPRLQGTFGVGGTDMVVGNATITASAVFPVDYATFALVPN